MNRENEKILEAIKNNVISECRNYTYDFNKENAFSTYLEKFAKYILEQLKNGHLKPATIPYLVKVIGKENKEFIIMYYTNPNREYEYRVIDPTIDEISIIDIDMQSSNTDKFDIKIEEKARFLTEAENYIDYNYSKVITKLIDILNPVLDKYKYIIVDRCNCDAILCDIGHTLSEAMNDEQITVEEVPYMKVDMRLMENGLFYIVFNVNHQFQIKKQNGYIPNRELPFDIKIN